MKLKDPSNMADPLTTGIGLTEGDTAAAAAGAVKDAIAAAMASGVSDGTSNLLIAKFR